MGTVCLTDYNNNTYRVDDVDWAKNPKDTFSLKDGTTTTFIEYYAKKYSLHIRDDSQPLLVSRTKARDRRAGQDEYVYLVPEFCRSTGMESKKTIHYVYREKTKLFGNFICSLSYLLQ